jgi:glyoxylase-like metal-dependent hydrolase (beta-lactamase superfamily II)
MHVDGHAHSASHADNHSHAHNHVEPDAHSSRRDFFRLLTGGALAGASVLELGFHRAAWARAAAPTSGGKLFDIQKAANGVFFAHARAQARVNCNAAIFVRSKDVVVVDAHSKPSAAASLIAQIKREVTEKPVRYVVNTHFHWDHTQGNHAYREAGEKVDFIATETTKQLLGDQGVARLKETMEEARKNLDALRERAAHATSAAEKAFCADQIRQLEAYQAEMKDWAPELPTITFDKTYLLKDPLFDLHLEFHGHAHTAGDVFVLCPQQRALATGDASHCWFPNIADGFPRSWPRTIDDVGKGDFQYVLGGHGPLQSDRTVMMSQRNYIEELVEKVEAGKKAGQSLAEMQKRLTVASLKSLQSNGYEALLTRTVKEMVPYFGSMPPLQKEVESNVSDVYRNLDRV